MKCLLACTSFCFFATLFSCTRPYGIIDDGRCSSYGPISVFKPKKDYTNNVPVHLSSDKKSLISYPGREAIQRPVQLVNGYYYSTNPGNAYLSITIDQYMDTNNHYSSDQLINYVIDTDPFSEYYNICICSGATRDTASLNRIIRHDSLGKCNSH